MNNPTDRDSLIDFAEMLLDDEKQVRLRMTGYSMYPTLRQGDLGVVEKTGVSGVRAGDIVVCRHGDRLVAHRLKKILQTDNSYVIVTGGDKNDYLDAPFSEKDLIGKLVYFTRNEKKQSTNSVGMRIKKFFAMNFHSLFVGISNLILHIGFALKRIKTDYRSFKLSFREILPGVEKLFRLNALFYILLGLIPLAIIVCFKGLIDLLAGNSVFGSVSNASYYILLGVTALLFLANSVVGALRDYYAEKMSQMVTRNVYAKLHEKHIRQEFEAYETPETLDKMHRAVQEAPYRPMRLLNGTLGFVKAVSSGIVLLVLFMTIRWYLVFILFVAVAPDAVFRVVHSRKLYRMKEAQTRDEREKHYYNRVLTGLPFAKELRLFDFAPFFLNKFNRKQNTIFTEKLRFTRSQVRLSILTQIFAVVLIFGSLGILSYLRMNGLITIGTMVLFFFAFQRGYAVMNEFSRSMTGLMEDSIYMRDLISFIKTDPCREHSRETKKPFSLKNEIRFEDLSFRYSDSERYVLKKINILIPAGKTVALVGENGAGKTTLIKLLCGFYKPVNGRITIDGEDIDAIGRNTVLANITAVFQDFALYQVSAGDNIMLGDYGKPRDFDKAVRAARTAGIDEALRKMPEGYETRLGHLFKESEELSIGQWQRMALARAFYRDAPLLLMDEPSSALDVNSERQIIESLRELAQNKTTLIVSHRLSTVQWADYIYLFDEGEVVEEGNHKELMARKGKYFAMFGSGDRVSDTE